MQPAARRPGNRTSCYAQFLWRRWRWDYPRSKRFDHHHALGLTLLGRDFHLGGTLSLKRLLKTSAPIHNIVDLRFDGAQFTILNVFQIGIRGDLKVGRAWIDSRDVRRQIVGAPHIAHHSLGLKRLPSCAVEASQDASW